MRLLCVVIVVVTIRKESWLDGMTREVVAKNLLRPVYCHAVMINSGLNCILRGFGFIIRIIVIFWTERTMLRLVVILFHNNLLYADYTKVKSNPCAAHHSYLYLLSCRNFNKKQCYARRRYPLIASGTKIRIMPTHHATNFHAEPSDGMPSA